MTEKVAIVDEEGALIAANNPLQTYIMGFDGVTHDSFGRLRTSNPFTLFDSKQLFDAQPLYWDDQEVSGGSTTTTYSQDRASTTLGVALNTAGKRARQTFQRFNYQPGKSQLVLCTGVLTAGGGGAGILAAMGYFDDNNGVFVSTTGGAIYMNIRSKVSGSVVDNDIAQSSWNGDKLDGSGDSGFTLDASKAQIFWFDIEWLGVGSVRCGFVINGQFILCHTFHHANLSTSVYMTTPNLPMRYEIENDGTGAASTLEHICSTVISEGGVQPQGQLHYESTGGTVVAATGAGTTYAVFGMRLKAAYIGQQVDLVYMAIMNTGNADYEWLIYFNPTVAGTFTYADHNGGAVQTATGATANTVTGGNEIAGGFVKSGSTAGDASRDLANALRLGTAIDGTPDEIVLCVRPLANSNIVGGLGWRELT